MAVLDLLTIDFACSRLVHVYGRHFEQTQLWFWKYQQVM